jgi:hypothetical protein
MGVMTFRIVSPEEDALGRVHPNLVSLQQPPNPYMPLLCVVPGLVTHRSSGERGSQGLKKKGREKSRD